MAVSRHVKYPAFIESIEGDRWWARVYVGDRELHAEMTAPLPKGATEGRLFTIHRTKRGATYLYWLPGPMFTKRQLKKARQRARERYRFFFDSDPEPTEG